MRQMTAYSLRSVQVWMVAITLFAVAGACASNASETAITGESISESSLDIAPSLRDRDDAFESDETTLSRPLIDKGRARRIADQSIKIITPPLARDAIVFDSQFLVSSEELLEMALRSNIPRPPESAPDSRFWVLAYHGRWPLAFSPGFIEVPFGDSGSVNYAVAVVGADSGLVIGTRTGLDSRISKLKVLQIGDTTLFVPAPPQPFGPETQAVTAAALEIMTKFPELGDNAIRTEPGPRISLEQLLRLSTEIDLDALNSERYPVDAEFLVVDVVPESEVADRQAPHYYAIVDLGTQAVVASGISGDQSLSIN